MISTNASPTPGLRVIVLVAGFSTRLGKSKALARVQGVSLLRGTLKLTANLGADEIVAVVPHNAARYHIEARGIKVKFVCNIQRALGLASSVRQGINAAQFSRAVLLLPVDLVDLKTREVRRLISRWRAAPRRVVARRIGPHGGTPVILPRWLYAEARSIGGDVGVRELLRQLPASSLVLVDMPSATFDIDTPQDLEIARRRHRRL